MPSRKHVKKVRVAPRTDANQNVREHIERVRKQNDYVIKKIAEMRAKQQLAAAQRRAISDDAASTGVIDGLQQGE